MFTVDRHIAIQAGWIAGPAFGVAMMAAPEYLHLGPIAAGLLFWGGIAVFLLTIAVVFVVSLHEEGKRKAVFGPIAIMALGALIFCGGAAWYFWPAKEKAVADGKPSGAGLGPDNFLHLECERVDFVLPNDGKFYHLEAIYDGTQEPIAQFTQRWISEYAATTGPHILPGSNSDVYKCRFTNYGPAPIFNVRTFATVNFMHTERQGGGAASRGVLASRNVEILIPKIEVGRGASFDFFASVKSSVIVQVQLPTSAEIQPLGGEAREKVNLILSLSGLAFFPKFWLVRLPKGTLKYVNFIAEVSHFHSSNETTVQMHVELKNTSSNLLKFQARLDGNVMGKTSPNRAISFDGIIGPDETKKFIYDRILNVPTNEKVGPTTPVLSGALEYDITYWQENYPEDRRQTAKHVDFELWRPFNPTAPDDGSKIRQTQQTITVKFSNEIEE